MVKLVPDSLKAAWRDASTQLNKVDGGVGVKCELIFLEQIESTSDVVNDPIGNKPRAVLGFGGQTSIRDMTGQDVTDHTAESGEGLRQTRITKKIDARIYPIERPFLRLQLGIKDNENAYQMNAAVEDMPFIERAQECILYVNMPEKRVRVVMWKPPVVYGLGQEHMCKCVWKEV